MKIKKQFAQEVKHRQAERNYSSNLSLGQRYIQKELRTLFNLTESETQKAQIDLLDRVFSSHLPKSIKRELNTLKANKIDGRELFECLKKIYYRHDLHLSEARRGSSNHHNSKLDRPIPTIVCSEGFV